MRAFTHFFAIFIFCISSALGQTEKPTEKSKPGTLYLSWGYNREVYTKSTLHLYNHTSDNYDFKMMNATAHDKSDFHNIGPINKLTIPQYDLHIGYLFNGKHNLGVELSWDHLKYVVTDNQVVRLVGQIRGREINKDTLVDPDFVHIQHTNGNNYLMLNVLKKTSLFSNKRTELSWINKVGAGPLYSFTISTVLGSHDPGHFRMQGYVIGLNTSLRYDFYKYFFLESTIQGAYVRYFGTELGADRQGRLSHHFGSAFLAMQFGFNLPMEVFKSKK